MRFFALLLVFLSLAVFARSQCTIDGVDISGLTAIADQTATTTNECGDGYGYSYAVSMCRAVTAGTDQNCNTKGSNFCQVSCVTGLGCPKNEDNPVVLMSIPNTYSFLADSNGNLIGVEMTGYNTPNQVDKQGIIQAYCPGSQGAPPVGSPTTNAVRFPTPNSNCNGHTFAFSDPTVCDVLKQAAAGGGGSDHKGGLSGGWIFCIILFVCFPVYFAVGCGLNYRKGSRSCNELTPNYAFWAAIPGLMKDGASFTWRKLRGLCGAKSTGSYETL